MRWFVLTVLTAAALASLGTMYLMEDGFDDVWFFATLVLFGVALLLYWLIFAGTKAPSPRDEEIAEKVAAAIAVGETRQTGERRQQTLSEPELVVEPSRTEPIVFPPPLAPTPAAFQFRGYTLYGRGDSRFFSKSMPPGAAAIELPPGYEAKWNDKKGKPILIEVSGAGDEPEVVQDVGQKACSAMVAPGEFCENFAKTGSKYCPRHTDYRGGDELFEVRKPGMLGRGKSQRFAALDIEVRVAKPTAKPLKFRRGPEPRVEVRVAKPSNTTPLEFKRGKAVEVNRARPSAKPLKLRPVGNVVVELDRR
ncbi:MAG TPA: hypothetical protein VGB18_03880, partial [Candidatus Thermoplasmatota archaeon]